ncbi:Manganese/iron superoxide dismutase [Lineolata rhizophorae]|uniref:Manganese/iron superoxide dismutase n=1 Tax=Lineolata rhizophorae TaxID=578093 RepID=A0A6A6NU84_9PEZI|nr:Manganese/iron superoxide dismutase [Lineolata rhizophorae]
MMPKLADEQSYAENGIPNFLTPDAFRISWSEYQAEMLKEVNRMVSNEGTLENDSLQTVILKSARDPAKAALFNHASMAWNNHMFFKGLTKEPVPIPRPTSDAIASSFGSLDSLRSTFIETAAAMFGPGFVWLVRRRGRSPTDRHDLSIVSTYLAGSPLPEAHYRRQPVDMNTQPQGSGAPPVDDTERARLTQVQNTAGAVGPYAAGGNAGTVAKRPALGGVELIPLACVNTWEHVWLPDWGIAGKRWYLERWWELIDWNEVDRLANFDSTKYMYVDSRG